MTSTEMLALMRADPEGFMAQIITHDETSVSHFDPKTKVEPKPNLSNRSIPPL